MLVLRRKVGEAVVVNNKLTVCVLGVDGERVKLGFAAPPDIVIMRQELLEVPAVGQQLAEVQQQAVVGSTMPRTSLS